MAVNRKLTFGYEMRRGSIALRSDEAEVVCMIYQQYVAGCSYAKLTQELNRQPVYYLPGKSWNKNMVAQILADERYLGTEQFPLVIVPQLYQKARDRIPSKAPKRKKSEFTDMIQRLAVCSTCGAKAVREPYSHGKERWFCPECKAITANVKRGMDNTLAEVDGAAEGVRAPSASGHQKERHAFGVSFFLGSGRQRRPPPFGIEMLRAPRAGLEALSLRVHFMTHASSD